LTIDSKSSQKLMAEMMRKGATLLREPCPECGGILFRFKGRDICPVCSGLQSVEELDEKVVQKATPPPAKSAIVTKILDDSLGQLAKEKDPARRLKLLQMVKLCAEVLKLLKE
jgi:UPF0148 protein